MQPIRWPQPGELWSLWNMLQFNASKFVEAISTLNRIQALEVPEKKNHLSDGDSKILLEELRAAKPLVNELGAEVTGIAIAELVEDLDCMEEKRSTYEELQHRLMTINNTLRRELSLITVFVVDRDGGKLLAATEPLFGQAVFDVFPKAIDDVAEAGKCLALRRGTAAVFHLMRVMEAGLRRLGSELGITYAPSWESYIRQLDKLLDASQFAKLSEGQKVKRPFYQDVLGDLVSVKSAWRNPTMHIVRTYDAEQAAVVFGAVRSFMQHLAKELSVDPSPSGQSS